MLVLKWYSIIFIIVLMFFMISKVYNNMQEKKDYKYELIGFILLLPLLVYVIGA